MSEFNEGKVNLFKKLLIWCRQNGVASIQIGDMSASLYPETPKFDEHFLDELKDQEDYEKTLFHSSGE